jgi:phenylalanyl-tRNA synthetase beta chain
MRRSMLVSALENLAYNARYTDRMAVFEIGRVYLPESRDDGLADEDRRLSLLLTGRRSAASVHAQGSDEEFDFFDLKGIIEALLSRLGWDVGELEFTARSDHPTFSPCCAEVQIGGQSAGVLGELHPRVRAAFELPEQRICAAELRLAPLLARAAKPHQMAPISSYPPVIEDLAFVVRENVPAKDVLQAIRAAGGALLVAVELFDVYRGEAVPKDHKSLAFRVAYQSLESTLNESQVTALRSRIVQQVGDAVGGALRA